MNLKKLSYVHTSLRTRFSNIKYSLNGDQLSRRFTHLFAVSIIQGWAQSEPTINHSTLKNGEEWNWKNKVLCSVFVCFVPSLEVHCVLCRRRIITVRRSSFFCISAQWKIEGALSLFNQKNMYIWNALNNRWTPDTGRPRSIRSHNQINFRQPDKKQSIFHNDIQSCFRLDIN